MLGNLFMATCFFTMNIIFITLAGALRLFPTIFNLMRRAIHGVLLLSVRFYDFILRSLDPTLKRQLGIDVHSGFWSIPFSILFSIVIGLSIFMLIGLPINGWSVGGCILHGFLVGLMWDERRNPQGLHLGETIE